MKDFLKMFLLLVGIAFVVYLAWLLASTMYNPWYISLFGLIVSVAIIVYFIFFWGRKKRKAPD